MLRFAGIGGVRWALLCGAALGFARLAWSQETPRPGLDAPRMRVAVADFRAIGGQAVSARQLAEALRKALAGHPQVQVVQDGGTQAAAGAAEGDLLSLKDGAARALGDKLGVDAVVYGWLVSDVSGLADDPVAMGAPFAQVAVVETLTLDGQLYPSAMVPLEGGSGGPARLAAVTVSLLPASGKVLAMVQSPEGMLTQLFPLGGRVLAPNAEYGVYDGVVFRPATEDGTGQSAALARQDLRPGQPAGRVRTDPAAEDHVVTATSSEPGGRVAVGQLVGLVPAGGALGPAPTGPTLLVNAAPADSLVTVDGKLAGVTPVAVALQADQKVLVSVQRRDWKPASFTLAAAAATGLALYPTLEELPPVGGLTIVTMPPGATVTLGDKELGKAPLSSDELTAGDQTLTVALEGFKVVKQTVVVRRQKTTEVNLSLEKEYRKVRVVSEPDGARVLLDGQPMGATPLEIGAVQTGAHEFQVTLPGHATEKQALRVTAGEAEQVVRFRMRAIAGNLRVESDPPGAAVALDGQQKGVTPLALTGIGVGEHRVDVTLDGYLPVTRTVAVEDQRTAQVQETLGKAEGRILCTSVPAGATITLDGKDAGVTPATLERVPIGKRTLALTLAGYQEWTARVPVLHGETTKVEVGLIREAQAGRR